MQAQQTPAEPAAPPPAPEPAERFSILDAAVSAARKSEWNGTERRTDIAEAPMTPAAPPSAPLDATEQARLAEVACREPLNKLVTELDLCRRYYEATFANKPVDRLVFIGGEARHRSLCQAIAQQLGIAAQVGDPLVRMGKTTEVGIESGIDRRQQQPNWAVAIGLSLGPAKSAMAGAEAA